MDLNNHLIRMLNEVFHCESLLTQPEIFNYHHFSIHYTDQPGVLVLSIHHTSTNLNGKILQ